MLSALCLMMTEVKYSFGQTKGFCSQAELVHKMKASGAARSIWQPHVAVLMELKQQLASAQIFNGGLNEVGAATSNGLQATNLADVARLEAEIVKQVRVPGISTLSSADGSRKQ